MGGSLGVLWGSQDRVVEDEQGWEEGEKDRQVEDRQEDRQQNKTANMRVPRGGPEERQTSQAWFSPTNMVRFFAVVSPCMILKGRT